MGTTMGMWVRAGELKDVPEPEYTREYEARRIKCSRVDWRSSRSHEQRFNGKPPPGAVGESVGGEGASGDESGAERGGGYSGGGSGMDGSKAEGEGVRIVEVRIFMV